MRRVKPDSFGAGVKNGRIKRPWICCHELQATFTFMGWVTETTVNTKATPVCFQNHSLIYPIRILLSKHAKSLKAISGQLLPSVDCRKYVFNLVAGWPTMLRYVPALFIEIHVGDLYRHDGNHWRSEKQIKQDTLSKLTFLQFWCSATKCLNFVLSNAT